MDCTEADLIAQFNDVMFDKPLWPAFSVNPSEKITVELKIKTGQEINYMPVHLLPIWKTQALLFIMTIIDVLYALHFNVEK